MAYSHSPRVGSGPPVAAEADDMFDMLADEAEKERREKIAKARKNETAELIPPSEKEKRETRSKLAEQFNTNRQCWILMRKAG